MSEQPREILGLKEATSGVERLERITFQRICSITGWTLFVVMCVCVALKADGVAVPFAVLSLVLSTCALVLGVINALQSRPEDRESRRHILSAIVGSGPILLIGALICILISGLKMYWNYH